MFQTQVRNFKSAYKRNANYEERRTIRAVVKGKERRETRLRDFDRNRNIDEDLQSLTYGVNENKLENDERAQKLKQWKQSRELLKMAETQRKAMEKPPFKCGVVHHKPFPIEFPSLPTLRRSNRKGNVESFAPKVHTFKAPNNVVPIELTTKSNKKVVQTSRVLKERSFQMIVQDKSSYSIRESSMKCAQSIKPDKATTKQMFKNNSFSFQPRRSNRLSSRVVPGFEKSRNKDENTKITNFVNIMENSFSPGHEEHDNTSDDGPAPLPFIYPANLSPWVSGKRGNGKETPSSINKTPSSIIKRSSSSILSPECVKDSGGLRKQIGVKLIEKMLSNPEEIKREENKYLSSKEDSTPSHGKGANVQHFRDLYSEEMRRLASECLEWDTLLLSEEIPVETQDSIRTTVAITRLLMREKLAQFKGLVEECEGCIANSKKVGQQLITTSDLQGFWDLVSIQVNDVDNKFSKLKILRDNNWVEVQQIPEKRNLRERNNCKIAFKTKNTNVEKKSGFQAFIQEQKKKKQLAEQKKELQQIPIVTVSSPVEKQSNIRATSFKLNTPVRSILKSGRRRKSSKMSITANTSIKEVSTPPMEMTPRRVTFKGKVGEESHGIKARVTPHSNKLKGNSRLDDSDSLMMTESQPSTPMPNGDLICWESPYQDDVPVRKSPRLKTKD